VLGRFLSLLVAAFALAATSPICAPTPPPARDEVLASPAVAATAEPTATVAPTPVPATVEGMRIVIPRLGIDLPLREGDAERDVPRTGFPGATPEGAAFHFPGTAIPGETGNAYIYSHARVGMFLSLWRVRTGDEVLIRTREGIELRYVVAEVHSRVPPSDTSWLGSTSDERLTLQTSTGAFPENPRFIAIARRVG
jgi:LPXTG-site transpeptidase (sortase) family protein